MTELLWYHLNVLKKKIKIFKTVLRMNFVKYDFVENGINIIIKSDIID